MLAQFITGAIKINYFPIFTSLILDCFHQLIYLIKFDFFFYMYSSTLQSAGPVISKVRFRSTQTFPCCII